MDLRSHTIELRGEHYRGTVKSILVSIQYEHLPDSAQINTCAYSKFNPDSIYRTPSGSDATDMTNEVVEQLRSEYG